MTPAAQPTVNDSSGNLQSGARVALLGMAINFVLALAKIAAGIFGNAYALIADGIESALDIGGSVVIWSGLKFAARPPDATHPYGHGKGEPVAAALVAVGVMVAAVGLAVQSVREIFLPHHAPAPFTLVVLIVVVVVKEFLYRFVIRIGRDVESTAMQTDAWHHRFDALTSVAAFVGISIALIGGATAVQETGSIFTNTSGTKAGNGKTAFTPPYSLSVLSASSVKSTVTSGAGATLSGNTCTSSGI